MKTYISIDGADFTNDDIIYLNNEADEKSVEFSLCISQGFLSPEFIMILIELSRNIGYMTAYDILKYALSKIFYVFSKKDSQKAKKFEIICNKKRYSIKYDFSLSEEQQDKLIDAAIKKILDDNT